jgi:hypothetical protein
LLRLYIDSGLLSGVGLHLKLPKNELVLRILNRMGTNKLTVWFLCGL